MNYDSLLLLGAPLPWHFLGLCLRFDAVAIPCGVATAIEPNPPRIV